MSSLYAYMGLRGDPAVKGLLAASLLVLIHPWGDGNGRVSRRMYRAYNPEDGSSDHAVRSRLERKIREWGVFWHGPGE
jgi:Fic family protein